MYGNPDRFISAMNETHSPTNSIEIDSPEGKEEKVYSFFKRKEIERPDGYDPDNTDWQYNSLHRRYEFRPGIDIYAMQISDFEAMLQSYTDNEMDSDSSHTWDHDDCTN